MISVCMATYNGAKYIREQLDSILTQLSASDELVVSDDGSSDTTLEILRSYSDERIKIYSNTQRKGVIGNFENALKMAQGDYIFLSDQDDVWIEGKVERCVAELKHFDLVIHDATIWSGESAIHDSYFKLRGSQSGYLSNLIKNSYIGCCMAFRHSALEYILPIPNIAAHDMWIGLMCEKRGTTKFINAPYLKYRRHGDNASATSEKSNFSLFTQVSYRLQLMKETILR